MTAIKILPKTPPIQSSIHPPIYSSSHPPPHPPIPSIAHVPTHPSTQPLNHPPAYPPTHTLDCPFNHLSIPYVHPPVCPCIGFPTDPSSFQRPRGARGSEGSKVSRAYDEMDPQGYGCSPACSSSMAPPVSSPCPPCLWLHSSFYIFLSSRFGRDPLFCLYPPVLFPLNLFGAQSCLRHFCPTKHHFLHLLSTDHQMASQLRIVQTFLPTISGFSIFISSLISQNSSLFPFSSESVEPPWVPAPLPPTLQVFERLGASFPTDSRQGSRTGRTYPQVQATALGIVLNPVVGGLT